MLLRLLLVEDHAAFRGALAFLLNLRPGMRVVAECGSLAECRALGDPLEAIDLALLDLMLPNGDGAHPGAPRGDPRGGGSGPVGERRARAAAADGRCGG